MPIARATSSPDPPAGADAAQVLITRPEPGASETAARVAALGLLPVVSPVLVTRPVAATLPPVADIAAVLVTSGAAIQALPEVYHALPLLTVGDATAQRARRAGFPTVVSASGDATDLAELAKTQLRQADGPLLLAAGRFQGNTLAEDLRAAGFRVIRRVVYASMPAPSLAPATLDALRGGCVRAAMFFSAETARQFVRLVQRAHGAPLVRAIDAISIGQPAAVALGQLPWRRIRVAARPNQDEMLALLR